MYTLSCFLVLFTVSAYGAVIPEHTLAMLLECKDVSGVQMGSMEYYPELFGRSRNATCFMACLDAKLKVPGPWQWNEDGSMKLNEVIDYIKGRDLEQWDVDQKIADAKSCSRTAAGNFCDNVWETVTCVLPSFYPGRFGKPGGK